MCCNKVRNLLHIFMILIKNKYFLSLKYSKKCENQEEFDNFLLEWMQQNNYEQKNKPFLSSYEISIQKPLL